MSNNKFLLALLFLPVLLILCLGWLIYWKLFGKKQNDREKTRKETKKKLLDHIRNFSPIRLKNRSWQKSIGKYKKKRKKTAKSNKKSRIKPKEASQGA
ncbi:MAG: hypothetical protein MRECE_2c065 [Mycoplasmataceae bacterium CE_OT135]|nr:MAG: hypothetical protein MRECE_2c065 [Mycoplasmataceae bacterium CE_OT135]